MSAFLGYPLLDGTGDQRLLLPVVCTNGSEVITEPDADPTYQILSPANPPAVMATGTLASWHTRSVSNVTNNGGTIRVTFSAAHGLQTNDRIFLSGITGTTEANGSWTVTWVSTTVVDLVGSTYSNAYVNGGTMSMLGLKAAQISVLEASSYERGKTYHAVVTYLISAAAYSRQFTFIPA